MGRAAVVFDLVLWLMGFVEGVFHKVVRKFFSSPSGDLCSDSRNEEFLSPHSEMGYSGIEPLMMPGMEQNSSPSGPFVRVVGKNKVPVKELK